MKKVFTKEDIEWKFQKDYWNYYQDYNIPENNDDYWESLVNEGNALLEKYANTEIVDYAKNVVLSFIGDVERRYQKLKEDVKEEDNEKSVDKPEFSKNKWNIETNNEWSIGK